MYLHTIICNLSEKVVQHGWDLRGSGICRYVRNIMYEECRNKSFIDNL